MIVVEIVTVGLVAFRLWRILGADTITAAVRDGRSDPVRGFLECPWCSGTWIAFGVTVGAWAAGWVSGPPVLVALGAAAVVGLVGDR